MKGNRSQQENLDQNEHDRWLLSQTPADLKRLARGLGDLARSKVKSGLLSSGSEPADTTPKPATPKK